MTIKLQIDHTYRTRDGKHEHRIARIEDGVAYGVDTGGAWSWWADSGLRMLGAINLNDLVEEVTTGPVRRRTVTRTEIVPGTYGRLIVGQAYGPDEDTGGNRWLFSLCENPSEWAALTAEEIDQVAATLTQMASALRAISAEKGIDQ